jgi:hypothetical protein
MHLTYVPRNKVTVKDFIVRRGTTRRENRNRVAHQNIVRIRDVIYVTNNYPSLPDHLQQDCQHMLLDHFKRTGGRMLEPVGYDDGYYIISESEEPTIIAAMFDPNRRTKVALEQRIRQRLQQPPVAPIVMDQPKNRSSPHRLENEAANYTLPDEDDDE